jgi:hypothetical protein
MKTTVILVKQAVISTSVSKAASMSKLDLIKAVLKPAKKIKHSKKIQPVWICAKKQANNS